MSLQMGELQERLDEAEETIDNYRQEMTRVQAERDKLAKDRDDLRELLRRYERITTTWTRGMYMTRIDCMRGDVSAAIGTLCEGLDGYDGTEWNGTETGAEWWERTKAEEGL